MEQHRAEVIYLLQQARQPISYGQYSSRYLQSVQADLDLGMLDRFISFPAWQWVNSYRDEAEFLKGFQPILEQFRAATDPTTGELKPKSWQQFRMELHRAHVNRVTVGTWRAGPELDMYSRMTFLFQGPTITADFFTLLSEAETRREVALGALALMRYKARHGEFPSSVEQLVPEFLPALPFDYTLGKPLLYKASPSGTLLFSAATEGVADSGERTSAARISEFVWLTRPIACYEHTRGRFVKDGQQWIESLDGSGEIFTFREYKRDNDWIYLHDPSRSSDARLPVHGGFMYVHTDMWHRYHEVFPKLERDAASVNP